MEFQLWDTREFVSYFLSTQNMTFYIMFQTLEISQEILFRINVKLIFKYTLPCSKNYDITSQVPNDRNITGK